MDQSNVDINDVISEPEPEPVLIDETLNIGGSASSKYGNNWSGLTDTDGSISFGFTISDSSKDLNLNAFYVDFTDEISVILNGKTIDHLDLPGNDNVTAPSFILANDDLISGANTLEFVNKMAAWILGIDQVSLA